MKSAAVSLVAGCRGPRTDEDFALLRSLGVHALARLAGEAETGLTRGDGEQNALQDCYEFVPDMTAPSQKQIDRVISFINRAVTNREAVAVSCGAGYGRTGTILACCLVSRRLSAEAAFEKLIAIQPCSREILRILGQKEAVFEFRRRMLKIQRRKEAI
ncbi:MAG TPA: protein-tyrosine phosphatase family protein [Vicinamibacterales bacterium]|nr:protein-tyrosine phosphatase family protein [Vicinamibacterales bacterium]